MKNSEKKRTSNGIEVLFFLVLVILLIFRAFILKDGEADVAITVVNFVGMIIAFLALLIKIASRVEKKIIRQVSAFFCLGVIVATIVISMLLFFGRISFDEKMNDCITIAALLFALPTNWLCELLFGK